MKTLLTKEALEGFLSKLGPLADGFEGAPVPTLLSCNSEEMTIRLSYDLADWMVNPWGVVHGGLITTLMDSAFGMLACCANGGVICPTISLTSQFLSSVTTEYPLIIEAKVERFGRIVAHLSAKCWQNGKLTNTATGVFSTASPRGTIPEILP